jgi:hypothetical protein
VVEDGGWEKENRVGVVPIRNWRRQGRRKAFHLYHTRMSGDIGDGDIVGCGGLCWGATVYKVRILADRDTSSRLKWILFFALHSK